MSKFKVRVFFRAIARLFGFCKPFVDPYPTEGPWNKK